MKNLVILFIAFLLLQFTSLAQEGWVQQSVTGAGDLRAVFMLNQNTGWVAGEGCILKTIDGGNTWQNIYSGGGTPYSLYFIDEQNGYWSGDAAGLNAGVIRKTTDGGINWDLVWGGELDSPLINSIQFIGSDTGWAVGMWEIILKTTNGGNNWITIQNTFPPPPPNKSGILTAVIFTDSNNGWISETIVGRSVPPEPYWRILNSQDGGDTWEIQEQGGGSLHSIDFINDQTGCAVGEATVSTTDGGLNWLHQFQNFYGHDIDLYDSNNGWVAGSLGFIGYSTDSGISWNEQSTPTQQNLNAVHFIDENTGWAVGDEGVIIRTTNGGVSFIEENEIDEISTEFLISQNWPNPFNSSSVIRYAVPQTSNVVIRVFDIIGNEIETLVNKEKPVGTYEITWFANNLPSGVYFYRIQSENFVETKKMVLMK